jgi:hypothetical protein
MIMSLLKYIDRLKRMDDLIRRKATGNAEEFARKLNVSPSQLFQELKEMKELGAPVEYSHNRKSYCYSSECKMVLDFVKDGKALNGGKNILNFSEHSIIIGESNYNLLMHKLES